MSRVTEMFFSALQAADYAGLKLEALYELLESGEIEAEKVNDRWRIRKSAIDAWLDADVSEEELEKLATKLQNVSESQARQILKDGQAE